MIKPHWTDAIARFSPCPDAMTYLHTQPDAETAWAQCQRGDWMLWLAGQCAGPPESEGRKPLVLASCACARLALPHFANRYPNDGRVLACIETAERWARGEATMAELYVARTTAADYAVAAYADAAYADAAYADAAYAAAARAAAAYAAAAYAAVYVAYAAACVRMQALAECADLVRLTYPVPPDFLLVGAPHTPGDTL